MPPIVIAHRGASGYRPEHTLESYRLAAEQGADYIEPDLVITSDGVLVARHENEIGGTTDVAGHPELASRRATKVIDGVSYTGWFTEDLTLAELKTLRAKERIPELRPQNTAYDGRFEVPTLDEVLHLRERLSTELRRPVGVYPETKHPAYFRTLGLPLEEPLVAALSDHGLDGADAPVFVQSFEAGSLRTVAERIAVPLVQLIGARRPGLATPEGLRSVAGYAHAVGPAKELVDAQFVKDAHAAGLLVHPYTFRREDAGDLHAELRRFLELGVDGFFTDNPDVGVAARG